MRLIDADELSFRCVYEGDCMASDEKCEKCLYYVCSYEEIQEQPTAYNLDKVVTELESKKRYDVLENRFGVAYGARETTCIDIDKAIDIVRKGGVE